MDERPDIVLIPCDRAEAVVAALAAFDLQVPIIHFHAGDVVAGSVCRDEAYRHIISLMASVHLCNGDSAKNVVEDLMATVGRSADHVYDVGSTMLDYIEIDESLVPDMLYDLIVYHPIRDDRELIKEELDEIENILTTNIAYADGHAEDVSRRPVFWIHPNGDPGSSTIIERMDELAGIYDRIRTYKDLPRTQFLGLMKNCHRYIGNSSSMVHEAPMWLRENQIIHIGDRNRNRCSDGIRTGGSDRIVKVLEVIDWNELLKTGRCRR